LPVPLAIPPVPPLLPAPVPEALVLPVDAPLLPASPELPLDSVSFCPPEPRPLSPPAESVAPPAPASAAGGLVSDEKGSPAQLEPTATPLASSTAP
jgi:hypothetical protein